MTDAEPVEASLRFPELYRTHYGAVYSACWRSLKDHHHAEDAVQETFLRAHRALARFEGTAGLRGWLLRIANNVCIDQARRQQRRPQLVGLEGAAETSEHPSPEDVWAARGLDVGGAWSQIPAEYRVALHMRHVQGLSHVEIARVLGRTPTQAKALLHRALRSLRSAWVETQTAAASAA